MAVLTPQDPMVDNPVQSSTSRQMHLRATFLDASGQIHQLSASYTEKLKHTDCDLLNSIHNVIIFPTQVGIKAWPNVLLLLQCHTQTEMKDTDLEMKFFNVWHTCSSGSDSKHSIQRETNWEYSSHSYRLRCLWKESRNHDVQAKKGCLPDRISRVQGNPTSNSGLDPKMWPVYSCQHQLLV